MAMPWYQKAAAVAVAVSSVYGGIHVGKALRGSKPAATVVQANDSFDTAIADGRLVLAELDGDSSRELVYFPVRGPPAIFKNVNGNYTPENELAENLYRSASRLTAVISSDRGGLTINAQLRELDGELSVYLKPLVAYTVLMDPNFSLARNNRLYSGDVALPMLADVYNIKQLADFIKDPSSLAATGLAIFGSRLLEQFQPKLTGALSYAQWAKSGPGWEDVGTFDGSMVKVAPGTWVNVSDKETLKTYEDLRRDPNVVWCGGPVRFEHPVGESLEDYYRRTERESKQRAVGDAQRRQFDQSVQQTYEKATREVDNLNRQLGNQSKQLQRDVGRQLDDWNRQIDQLWKRR